MACRCADDDVGVFNGFRDAVDGLHLKPKCELHLACKGNTIFLVTAVNAGAIEVANGGSRGELGSRLRAAADDADDLGVWRTEMPDRETSDRTGPEAPEARSENDAFELGVVGRPYGDDLRMLGPIEWVVDAKARKRFLAQDTANGKNEIASVSKRHGEINRLAALAWKAVSTASIATAINPLSSICLSIRIFITATSDSGGILQPQSRLRSRGRMARRAATA